MPDERKSLAAALAEVTDEDVASATEKDETTEGETEEKPEEEEAEEEGEAKEGDEEGEKEASGDEAASDEDEEEEGDDDEDEEEEASPFEGITSDQLSKIKANPETHALFKSIMKSYTQGTQKASEALKLVAAFQTNPDAVMAQIAAARGGEYKPPTGGAAKKETSPDPEAAAAEAAKELESLFGEKLGPRVRGVFEKWFEARIGPIVTPLKSSLGRVISQGEQARMLNEEQAYKVRYSTVLTPEIEDEVVKLGESGDIVPGPESTPAQFLDLLTEIVLARHGKKTAKSAKKAASEALAKRIRRNADDREPAGASGRSPVKNNSKVLPTMTISQAFDAAVAELDEEGA